MAIGEELTVIAEDGERWTRGTINGAKGLADYVTYMGRATRVYRTEVINSAENYNFDTSGIPPLYEGKAEDVPLIIRTLPLLAPVS